MDKRSPLFIRQRNPSPRRETPCGFENPDQCKDSKGECRPVNKGVRGLVSKDCPKVPGHGNGARKVSFRRGEGISCCCAFKEKAVWEENEYVVVSMADRMHARGEGMMCGTYKARKTKTFVQMPAL